MANILYQLSLNKRTFQAYESIFLITFFLLFAHIFVNFDVLHMFLSVYVSIWCPFSSYQRAPYSIFCSASLLVTNTLFWFMQKCLPLIILLKSINYFLSKKLIWMWSSHIPPSNRKTIVETLLFISPIDTLYLSKLMNQYWYVIIDEKHRH
jgi:hypothetical protein